jgi:hypothetical protein
MENRTKALIIIGVVIVVIGIIVIGTVGIAAILAYFIYSGEQTATSDGASTPSVMHRAMTNNIVLTVSRDSDDQITITNNGGTAVGQLQDDSFGPFTITVNSVDCSRDGSTDTITVSPAEGLGREVGSEVTLSGPGVNPTSGKGVPVVITAHYLHTFDATVFSDYV